MGGVTFSIEEPAYRVLDEYLSAIQKHFDDESVSDDIELSISEKLVTKNRSLKKAVILKDIEEIVSQMGTIEEVTGQDEQEEWQDWAKGADTRKFHLYRNTDNAVLWGVASGLSNYFNIDPIFIRLGFVILTIASGFMILLYLLLWVIVPKAETTSQKLEMKGEKADINNIEKHNQQLLKDIPTKGTLGRIFHLPIVIFGKLWNASMMILSKIFIVLRGFFGGLFIITSILVLLGISSLFFTVNLSCLEWVSDSTVLTSLFEEFILTHNIFLASFGIYISIAIPLLLVFILGIKLVFQKVQVHIGLIVFMILLWILSFGSTVGLIASYSGDIEKLIISVEKEIEKNPETRFHIGITGEDFQIIDEDDFGDEQIPFGEDPQLIWGDAVPVFTVPWEKEFSIIIYDGKIDIPEIYVEEDDEVTLRFMRRDESTTLKIPEFNIDIDISQSSTADMVFVTDVIGTFEIQLENVNKELKTVWKIIVQ